MLDSLHDFHIACPAHIYPYILDKCISYVIAHMNMASHVCLNIWAHGTQMIFYYVVHYKFRQHHYMTVVGLNTVCIILQQLWPHEYVL